MGKTAPVPVKIYDYYEPGVPLMNICGRAGKHSMIYECLPFFVGAAP